MYFPYRRSKIFEEYEITSKHGIYQQNYRFAVTLGI